MKPVLIPHPTKEVAPVPFYRYFNGFEHFYTSNANEIGTIRVGAVAKFEYRFEGIQCRVYPVQEEGTVPLYRYWNGKDHFYTTNAAEIGTTTAGQVGKYEYRCEGIAGYVYPNQHCPIVSLLEWW